MPSVLIIDDNSSVLQSLEFYLQFEGFSVLLASDGASGLKQAAEHPVDIVLLDIEMPLMSGLKVCEKIKSDPTLRHLPVVMMTGRPLRDLVSQAIAAGAALVLGKPFDLDHLRKTLLGQIAPAATQ